MLKERGLTEIRNSELVLSPQDAHPAAAVHEACGTFLAEWFQKNFR